MGYLEEIDRIRAAKTSREKEVEDALSIEPERGALQWTFDQILRPQHASLGAIKAGVEGKPFPEILEAGKKGALLQEKTWGTDLEKAIADWGARNPALYPKTPLTSLALPPPTETAPERFDVETPISRLLSHKRDTRGQIRGLNASRDLVEGYHAAKGFGEGLASASRGLLYEIGLDPLTYVPIVGPAKALKTALTPAARAMKLPQAFQKIAGTKAVDDLGKAFKPFFGMDAPQKKAMRKFLWGKEAKKKEFEEGIKGVFKAAKLTNPQAELASAGIVYPELMKGAGDPVKVLDDLLAAKGAEGAAMRERSTTLESILGIKTDEAAKALKQTQAAMGYLEKRVATATTARRTAAEARKKLAAHQLTKDQIDAIMRVADKIDSSFHPEPKIAKIGIDLLASHGLDTSKLKAAYAKLTSTIKAKANFDNLQAFRNARDEAWEIFLGDFDEAIDVVLANKPEQATLLAFPTKEVPEFERIVMEREEAAADALAKLQRSPSRAIPKLEELAAKKNQIEQLLELGGTKQQRAAWKAELAELGGKLEEHKGLFETPEKELRGIAESLAQETPEARAGIAEASKFGRETLDELFGREKDVLGTPYRERYFPGIYPKEVTKRGGAFTAGKTFVSPVEAKAAGYEPEMNMWAVIAERGRKSIDKVDTRLFTEDMLARYGAKIESKEQLMEALGRGERIWAQRQKNPRSSAVSDIKPWVEERIKKLTETYGLDELSIDPRDVKNLSQLGKNSPLYTMPEPLVHWMNNYEKRMADGTLKTIAQWNTRYMNYFRGYATMPRMAFHLRNTVDNYFRLFLDIGPEALNPRWNVNAAKVLFKGTKGKIELHGKEYSFDQIRKLMEEHGLRRHGWLGADTWTPDLPQNINRMFEGHGKKMLRSANPFSVEDFGLLKAGRWLGSNIEDHAHAVSFLKNLDKTGDPYKAAMRAHQFLFDYRELTPFERRAGKFLMPFYTFFRKNVPFQAEQIVTQPGKYALVPKAKRFIENLSEEPDYTPPEYMATSYSVRLPVVRTEKDAETGRVRTYDQYANMSMSFQELNQLSTMGDLISRLHPGLKMIAEKFAEKEAFSDIPGGLSEGRLAKLGDGVALLPESVREKLEIKRYRHLDGTVAWKMPSRTLYDLRLINPLIPETLKYLKEDKFSKLNIDWKRLTTGALTTELDPETQRIYNRFAIGEKKRAYIKQKRQEAREVKP